MIDIKRLFIFAGGSLAVILLLIAISRIEAIPSSVVVSSAIFLVVVLPIILAIKLSKKEKERENAK